MRNKIQHANRDLTTLKGEIEEQELLLRTTLTEMDGAKECLQDITLMERYQVCFGNFFSCLKGYSLAFKYVAIQ